MFVDSQPTVPRLDDTLLAARPPFIDRLEFVFELSSVLQPLPIVLSGHNIVHFAVDLRSSGFTGEISFTISDNQAFKGIDQDKLVQLFRTPSLLQVRLAMRPEHVQQNPEKPILDAALLPLVECKGVVTEKSLVDRVARHLSGGQVSYRLYHLRFADPAQVLWRQHFPVALYTQKSLQEVITQNLNPYVTVQFIDTTLATIQPLIFLGLNAKNRPEERASFYDLLMWQLDVTDRMWVYDYTQKTYVSKKATCRR